MKICDCGHEVAINAETCPKCGHRFGVSGAFVALIIILVIIPLMCWGCVALLSGPPDTSFQDQERAIGHYVDTSEQHQADRLAAECRDYVALLPRMGIQRDFGNSRVIVDDTFRRLSFEHQTYAAGMIRCDSPSVQQYALVDRRTGRQFARYERGALILAKH